ncbi:MAG TPA: HRDC domain-containing protein [Solirubrobacteraceae bacterium]|nr:HRDC domain-containing protein [Solirubrobacteraceae bacterium]
MATVGRGSRRVRAAESVNGARSRGNGASAHGSTNDHDAAEEIELDPVDGSAFEKLKAWRMGRSEGKPAFTVAANAALEGALRARPATIEQLIEVKGIGPAFCERHGESLLQVLAEL